WPRAAGRPPARRRGGGRRGKERDGWDGRGGYVGWGGAWHLRELPGGPGRLELAEQTYGAEVGQASASLLAGGLRLPPPAERPEGACPCRGGLGVGRCAAVGARRGRRRRGVLRRGLGGALGKVGQCADAKGLAGADLVARRARQRERAVGEVSGERRLAS